MIKEKHEKGQEGPKEEATASDKDSASSEVRVKKEDDIKKEPTSNTITKNGGIVGSTNTGSVQGTPDRKPDLDDMPSATGAPDTAPLAMKQEDSVDGDGLTEAAFGLGGPGPGGGPPADSGQPLPSNVKPPSAAATAMEVHYMQQQSQIFVFSTMLANSGAEEVQLGRYPSIIAYHCAQPGTKKYLEKNPLKVTQFNRQNPAQWLNSLAMAKGGGRGCARSPGLGTPKGGPPPAPSLDSLLGADALDDMVMLDAGDAPWESKPHLGGLGPAVANGLPPDIDGPSLGGLRPKLQGVQVPDENLTPQQRQHREEKLVTMRKLQQMLFPESSGGDGAQDPNQQGQPPNAQQGQQPNAQQGQPPNAQQGQQGQPAQPGQAAPAPDWQRQRQMAGSGGQGGPVVPVGPGSCGGTSGGPPTSRGSQGPSGQRLQGPPPPYHQTPRSASVPIALQSPNPASPNNPTSNLSLPSPRASSSSALNSPADPNRPFGLTRHLSTGHSPTSQDSPSGQRVNHSNPGTPMSVHLSPSVSSLEAPATGAASSSDVAEVRDPLLSSDSSEVTLSTASSDLVVPKLPTPKNGVQDPIPSSGSSELSLSTASSDLVSTRPPMGSEVDVLIESSSGSDIGPPIKKSKMDEQGLFSSSGSSELTLSTASSDITRPPMGSESTLLTESSSGLDVGPPMQKPEEGAQGPSSSSGSSEPTLSTASSDLTKPPMGSEENRQAQSSSGSDKRTPIKKPKKRRSL